MSTKAVRIVGFIIVIVMLVGILSACQTSDTGETSDSEKIAALFMGPTTDESWNQFGFEGIQKAKEDCGIDYAFTENVKQTEFEETMRNYAQEAYATIIGHSGTFTDSAKSIASEFPETHCVFVSRCRHCHETILVSS